MPLLSEKTMCDRRQPLLRPWSYTHTSSSSAAAAAIVRVRFVFARDAIKKKKKKVAYAYVPGTVGPEQPPVPCNNNNNNNSDNRAAGYAGRWRSRETAARTTHESAYYLSPPKTVYIIILSRTIIFYVHTHTRSHRYNIRRRTHTHAQTPLTHKRTTDDIRARGHLPLAAPATQSLTLTHTHARAHGAEHRCILFPIKKSHHAAFRPSSLPPP